MRTKQREFKVGDQVVLYQHGEVMEVVNSSFGVRVRVRPDDGEEFWIDANRLRNK